MISENRGKNTTLQLYTVHTFSQSFYKKNIRSTLSGSKVSFLKDRIHMVSRLEELSNEPTAVTGSQSVTE